MLSFGLFRFDAPNACIWRGTEALHLSPKASGVLQKLLAQQGQIVSKEALLETVWPDVAVTDAALTVCIGELRRLLGDAARKPQFIETVHRRGYRFIAPVVEIGDQMRASVVSRLPRPVLPQMVGREAELRRLHDCLAKVQHGERQVVFVAGEPGIGKTTLLDAFVTQIAAGISLWIARGQCIAHYGVGEAYLPVLSALEQLCREADGEQILTQLERYAPTWLVHMPSLLSASRLEALQRKVQGTSPERMLREIAEALEALTSVQPLVMVLEDLHWGDMATMDLIAWLARRRQPGRLLFLCTYRPVDVIVRHHPLRAVIQELVMHHLCTELPLELLNEAEVGQFLNARGNGRVIPEALSSLLYQRTEGNPLFLVTLVAALERQGIDWEALTTVEAVLGEVPQSLIGMVERQLAQCSPTERQALEAASVAGLGFAGAAVAAGVDETLETIDQCYEKLARRGQFLSENGFDEWPDGTVTTCYCFQHALYQQAIYEQIAQGRRRRLHQQIGQRLEDGFGDQAGKLVAELAVHFERGGDYHRAIPYLQQAGQKAIQRSAHAEAVAHLRQGLALLKVLPETRERLYQELDFQVALGPVLLATKGYANTEVGRTYDRAWELCQQLGDTPHLFPVLRGMIVYHQSRGELQKAVQFGEQLLELAQAQPEPALLMLAHHMLGQVLFFRGEPAHATRHHMQSLATYNPQEHPALTLLYGVDLGVGSNDYLARELWQLGYPDQALHHSQLACRQAQEVAHPYSLAFALTFSALLHQFRREIPAVYEQAKEALALSIEHGFALWAAYARVLYGWALAMQGQEAVGIAEMHQGLDASLATGTKVMQPYLLGLLAGVYGNDPNPDTGLSLLTEALAVIDTTEVRFYAAELYRLKGTLLLKQTCSAAVEAEACFQQALDITRYQQAKSWELRVTTSLTSLWQQQGKRDEARELLGGVYGWFTEGFDTADLQDAKVVLDELPQDR